MGRERCMDGGPPRSQQKRQRPHKQKRGRIRRRRTAAARRALHRAHTNSASRISPQRAPPPAHAYLCGSSRGREVRRLRAQRRRAPRASGKQASRRALTRQSRPKEERLVHRRGLKLGHAHVFGCVSDRQRSRPEATTLPREQACRNISTQIPITAFAADRPRMARSEVRLIAHSTPCGHNCRLWGAWGISGGRGFWGRGGGVEDRP